MLLKLRTPGCIIVGVLCVVLSVIEPLRWLVWDMLTAVVVGMVCIRLLLLKRAETAQPVPEPQEWPEDGEQDDEDPQYDDYFYYEDEDEDEL